VLRLAAQMHLQPGLLRAELNESCTCHFKLAVLLDSKKPQTEVAERRLPTGRLPRVSRVHDAAADTQGRQRLALAWLNYTGQLLARSRSGQCVAEGC